MGCQHPKTNQCPVDPLCRSVLVNLLIKLSFLHVVGTVVLFVYLVIFKIKFQTWCILSCVVIFFICWEYSRALFWDVGNFEISLSFLFLFCYSQNSIQSGVNYPHCSGKLSVLCVFSLPHIDDIFQWLLGAGTSTDFVCTRKRYLIFSLSYSFSGFKQFLHMHVLIIAQRPASAIVCLLSHALSFLPWSILVSVYLHEFNIHFQFFSITWSVKYFHVNKFGHLGVST